MVNHGYPWLTMVIHGCPWLTMGHGPWSMVHGPWSMVYHIYDKVKLVAGGVGGSSPPPHGAIETETMPLKNSCGGCGGQQPPAQGSVNHFPQTDFFPKSVFPTSIFAKNGFANDQFSKTVFCQIGFPQPCGKMGITFFVAWGLPFLLHGVQNRFLQNASACRSET